MAVVISSEDDFPYSSDDPSLQPPQMPHAPSAGRSTPNEDVEEIKILMRLLVGTAFEGNDELKRRARLWQAEINATDPSKMVLSPEDETDVTRMRYALLGILFQAPKTMSNGLSWLEKTSSRAITMLSGMFAPLANSHLAEPVRGRFNLYVAKGESIVNAWVRIGRFEEQMSRALVRQEAYDETVNDIIDYLAQKPEVRDLVQQQSMSMAEEVVEEFRERSADVDTLIEKRFNSILRRSRSEPQTLDSN